MFQFLAQETPVLMSPTKRNHPKKSSKTEPGDQGWKTCDLMKQEFRAVSDKNVFCLGEKLGRSALVQTLVFGQLGS